MAEFMYTNAKLPPAPPPANLPPPPPPAARRPPPPPPAVPPRDPEEEVNAVATWFARIGAVALLLAAGFGYSYAVEQGLVTTHARVALGLILGMVLVLLGEASRRHEWSSLAQSLTGGGTGVLYLSLWAAYERYGLIDAPTAFWGLAFVAGLGVALAWRHESEALTILGAFGGFLVPYLIGDAMSPGPVLAFVAILDAAILTTVTFRPWRIVQRLALAGTWIFAAVAASSTTAWTAIAYGALFWALFAVQPVIRAGLSRRRTHDEEAPVAAANAFAFWAYSMTVMGVNGLEPWRGAMTALLGAAHLGLGMAVQPGSKDRANLGAAMLVLGGGFLALAVPIQFEGSGIAAAWTVQAIALVALGSRSGSKVAIHAGVGLFALALGDSLLVEAGLGAYYAPDVPIVSGLSITLLFQIAGLHVLARLLRDDEDETGRTLRVGASVGAHLLALLWGGLEAAAYWTRVLPGSAESAVQFTLTVEWSVYATALLIAGVLTRRRRARLVGVGILIVTISKVATIDLWLLSTPHRVIAFGALGMLLLLCSLMYHRFRALILEA